jgi:hypothetical protein
MSCLWFGALCSPGNLRGIASRVRFTSRRKLTQGAAIGSLVATRGLPGNHRRPALMGLCFPGLAALLCGLLGAPAAEAQGLTTFAGSTPVGVQTAAQTVTVTDQVAGQVSAVEVLTLGQLSLDFAGTGSNTCTGANLALHGTCQIAVTFTPQYPGIRNGAVVLLDSSNQMLATQYLSGTGQGALGVMVPGTMQTAVGSGQWTGVNDGQSAAAADLYLPAGEAVDGAGDIFIADSAHNRIREVYASGPNKGLIETICNTSGQPNYTGDGGLAVDATISNPQGIAIDGAGNLYIADTGNNAIREINAATGIITSVVNHQQTTTAGFGGDGGAATAALLDTPFGVTVDAAGNIYVADSKNQRIREVTAATGIITTVVGKGDTASPGVGEFSGDGGPALQADLNLPYAVTFDAAGNMYIPDSGNNRIRIVYASGALAGTIATFAGNGKAGIGGDNGAAIDASFFSPEGIAIDVAGNLYVADNQNNRVRKITPSGGNIITVAGNGTGKYGGDGASATAAGLYGPQGLFLDGMGNLYIADYFDHRIREIQSNLALLTFTPAIRVDGVTAPLTQTIENDGNASLTFATIAPDANAAIDAPSTTCSISTALSVDADCNVGAEFAPTVVGNPVIGNINLTGNPADSPLDIQVSGEADALTSTTTTLSPTPNPALFGAQVVLSASVSTGTGTLTGKVTFMDGATVLGSPNLSSSGLSGTATFSITTLTVGAHQLTAVYEGDGVHGTSTSPVFTETIQETTTVTVTPSLNPSVSGNPVTFTATVTPAADGGTAPTGTVIFSDGSTVLGSSALTGNAAAFTISTLTVGPHSITAAYNGDAENAANTSAALSQVVNPTASTAMVTSSANPSIAGKPVTLMVTVTGTSGTPTGSVTLKDGAAILAPLSLAGGSASYPTSTLAVGTHPITAVYSGDANNAATTSRVFSQVVNQATTTTVAGASANPVTAGKAVNLTAAVTGNGGTPTGTVRFYSGATLLGTATLNAGGSATLSTSGLGVGADSITAIYLGDTNDAGSTSAPYALSVLQATSSVTLSSNLNPVTVLRPVTFTAKVTGTGGTPTGQVIFSDGGTPLGTVSLNGSGAASFPTANLAVGQHSITAAYQGDANDGKASNSLTETIQQASPSVVINSSVNPSTVGATVALTTTLNGAAGAPTGNVVFQDGGTTIGTVGVGANGRATLSISTLTLGQHPITASYSGDTNNAAGTGTLTQTVQDTTATTLVSSKNPSIGGTPVTFTATVTVASHGTLTGTVTFRNGGAALNTVSLNGAGVASYTTSTLPVGADSITAVYSGGTLDATSTSAPLTQTVQSAGTTTTLTSSGNPSLLGANVTFTATVTGTGVTPTGNVTFKDGSTTLATMPVGATGIASYSTSTLAVGVHPITASYNGDQDDQKDISAVLNQTVQAHTTILVNSSSNPTLAASQVIFTASVSNGSGAPPTGTVTLKDGANTLITLPLPANDTVTFSTSSLTVGQHSITAVYGGDTDDVPATSAVLVETIQAIPTKTTLGASTSSLNTDQQLSLVASVFSAGTVPITGTVTFQNGTTVIGSTALTASGTATISPTLTAGTYSIVAVYGGDADNASSTSLPVSVTVTEANDFQMSLNPSSVTMATKQYSTVTLTLASTDGFTDDLGLGCASLPASVTCSFSKDTVNLPANGTATIQLTVDTASPLTSGGSAKNVTPGRPSPTLVTAWIFPGSAVFGLFFWRFRRRYSGLFYAAMVILLSSAAFTITGCGGLTTSGAQPGTYTFQVTADGVKTGMNHSVNVTLTINQ